MDIQKTVVLIVWKQGDENKEGIDVSMNYLQNLRAIVSNYRESADSCKNSKFFFFRQKIPLGKLFSKTIFKSSSEALVWRKIEKFEI